MPCILHVLKKVRQMFFLTIDDSIIKKALQNKDILRVRIENPVKWLMEAI